MLINFLFFKITFKTKVISFFTCILKVIYSYEFKNAEKAYSYFDEKATFQDINSLNINKENALAENKANDKGLTDNFEIESIVQVGYPD